MDHAQWKTSEAEFEHKQFLHVLKEAMTAAAEAQRLVEDAGDMMESVRTDWSKETIKLRKLQRSQEAVTEGIKKVLRSHLHLYL